jgi:hypothetical protein
VLVFNIGANVPSSILEETARKYFKIWEMACFGGFLNGREVARRDGQARTAAPSCSPARRRRCAAPPTSPRSPVRSMRCVRSRRAWRASSGRRTSTSRTSSSTARSTPSSSAPTSRALCDQGEDGILSPDHIAETYWYLHTQPRDTWTFELDLRPWNERW